MAKKAKTMEIEKTEISKEFQVGDLAVYPAHGVGRIESIECRTINGDKHEFYILKILDNSMVIMIPTRNVASVGLRDVIDKKEIPRIFSVLRKKKNGGFDNQTWNRRYKEYMDKIKSGSLYDVADVFRDLSVLKQVKDLSFGERKLLDTARSLLLKELCMAQNAEEETVWAEIDALYKKPQQQTPP
jgi:CarD family transcriptional regulator